MITYLKGDATEPWSTNPVILCHICNDMGYWGKGFVKALSKKWKKPEEAYRKWASKDNVLPLGEVQFVSVTDSITVANIIGQHDIQPNDKGEPPIRYWAVRKGLEIIRMYALSCPVKPTIHMPKMGSGLAGGDWKDIAVIVFEVLKDFEVYVYEL